MLLTATQHHEAEDLVAALLGGARVRVFIPGRDREGRILQSRSYTASIEGLLVDVAGGATTISGIGVWRDGRGRVVRERIRVVESYLPYDMSQYDRSRLLDACFLLARQARQVCVAVAVDPGRIYYLSAQDELAVDDR